MIPYFDYRPEYRKIRSEIREALDRVLDSGRLILGPEVAAFEEECARALDVGGAVGVANGTDALTLALKALGIGAGDEVITVSNAGVPPVAGIRGAGATPVFVDVDPDTLLLDPDALEQAHGPRTRAVLVVHLYGQPARMDAIGAFAESHGLKLIEDCAQAFGARYRGRAVGSIGDVGCSSFYPTKVLGAYGDGGLCVARETMILERLRSLRMYGYRGDGHAYLEGMNSRLDELQAAILRVKLRHLDAAVAERRGIAALYEAGLQDSGYRLVGRTPDGDHVHHLFVVEVAGRDALIERLERDGVGYGVHYPEPVHLMQAYAAPGFGPGSLPVTERVCRTVLSLPIYPGMPRADVERTVDALRAARPAVVS